MKVSKLKDIHYNYQTQCILAKKRSITTITSPKRSCLHSIISFCYYFYWQKCIFLNLIAYDCTGHVESSCMGTDISITSANCNHQNCKLRCTKCSSFQISHLIVRMGFIPFWGYLQLDHPVTCGNIKYDSHIQIITWITICYFLNNRLPLIVLQK